MRYIIIPGISDSGAEHWQTLWQQSWGPAAARISPSSWERPDLTDWCRAIDRAVDEGPERATVLIAHSLGCLAVAAWATRRRTAVAGVYFVAPPDADGPNFPAAEAPTFTKSPTAPLGIPGLVVLSDDDPYCVSAAGRELAGSWGLDHVAAGPLGHINAASGLGAWKQGRDLLTAFIAGLGR